MRDDLDGRHASQAGDETRPILVTGMPRTGTSWVGRMLCAGGEAGYLNEPFNPVGDPGTFRLRVGHSYPYVTPENESGLLAQLAEAFRFRYPLRRELARCRNVSDLRNTLKWWNDFHTARGRRPLVKDPHAVFAAPWFANRIGSGVVVTVRHPAAVVASWKRLGFDFDFGILLAQPALVRERLGAFEPAMRTALESPGSLVERVALLWRIIYSFVADDLESGATFRLVRHEDLSRDPLGGYERLYADLGLTFTEAAAAAVSAASSSENPKETQVESPYVTQLDSKANLDRWRGRLTPEERERTRAVTEETALRFYPALKW
jgi:hypothetical protein